MREGVAGGRRPYDGGPRYRDAPCFRFGAIAEIQTTPFALYTNRRRRVTRGRRVGTATWGALDVRVNARRVVVVNVLLVVDDVPPPTPVRKASESHADCKAGLNPH